MCGYASGGHGRQITHIDPDHRSYEYQQRVRYPEKAGRNYEVPMAPIMGMRLVVTVMMHLVIMVFVI